MASCFGLGAAEEFSGAAGRSGAFWGVALDWPFVEPGLTEAEASPAAEAIFCTPFPTCWLCGSCDGVEDCEDSDDGG